MLPGFFPVSRLAVRNQRKHNQFEEVMPFKQREKEIMLILPLQVEHWSRGEMPSLNFLICASQLRKQLHPLHLSQLTC